jgi:hypothetical protein
MPSVGDNLFCKDGTDDDFAFIDWQMLAAGTPGQELVQVLSSCYSNVRVITSVFCTSSCSPVFRHLTRRSSLVQLDDYDKLDDIVAEFHAKLLKESPDWVAQEYSLDVLMEDFRLSTILFFLGVVGQLYATMEALCPPAGSALADIHPLWGLFSAWFPRMCRCLKQLGCAEIMTEYANRAEEGEPPAGA